jgi:serine/threonine-protein kinase HipA
MRLQSKLYQGKHHSSQYLCGLIADSLPDGWGMLLMDRFFRKELSVSVNDMNVLHRLAYIGDRAMGALGFRPIHHSTTDDAELSLSQIAQANEKILSGQDSEILAELIVVGGSPQGARSKGLVMFDINTQTISTDLKQAYQHDTTSATPWLIKFPAQHEDKSVCLLEALYADMATRAGLVIPKHYYFNIDSNHAAFGVERFDRVSNGMSAQSQSNPTFERVHIHTLAGLLDLDFRLPSLDYLSYLRCVRMMTQSQAQVEQAYRHVVFNVVMNSKDDHSKNFSFIMDKDGKWSLAPVYDVTYNTGINGYHQMDVCGEAQNPTLSNLLNLAKLADIKTSHAKAIVEQVVITAEHLLAIINDYPIHKALIADVQRDINANVSRMVNTSLRR